MQENASTSTSAALTYVLWLTSSSLDVALQVAQRVYDSAECGTSRAAVHCARARRPTHLSCPCSDAMSTASLPPHDLVCRSAPAATSSSMSSTLPPLAHSEISAVSPETASRSLINFLSTHEQRSRVRQSSNAASFFFALPVGASHMMCFRIHCSLRWPSSKP